MAKDVIAEKLRIAQIQDETELHEHMLKTLTEVAVECPTPLTQNGRNLFSVAFKNAIAPRRMSWRHLRLIQSSADDKGKDVIKKYLAQIEIEMKEICDQVQGLIDEYLISKATEPEAQVFYLKMKADYYRYHAEFAVNEDKKISSEMSLLNYRKATEASSVLGSTNPVRLGLALNHSVFFYEIMGLRDRACEIAKGALNTAMPDIDSLSGESYNDTILIAQLLRDNLTLWTSDAPSEDEDDPISPKGEN